MSSSHSSSTGSSSEYKRASSVREVSQTAHSAREGSARGSVQHSSAGQPALQQLTVRNASRLSTSQASAHQVSAQHVVDASSRKHQTSDLPSIQVPIPSHHYSQQTTSDRTRTDGRVVSTQLIGREVGESRLVSVVEHAVAGEGQILSEKTHHTTIKVPKKIVREEVIQKTIIVPEVRLTEHIVEEMEVVPEKVIEVQKLITREKIVEVPEIEIVETVIEVPTKEVQYRNIEVPKLEIRERIIEKPVITYEERLVEVPEVQYRDTHVETVVEVPQVRYLNKIVNHPVPTYVDKEVPEYVSVDVTENVHRKIPVPVEAVTTTSYELPEIRRKKVKSSYPVYLPRFIEVPVPRETLTREAAYEADEQLRCLEDLRKQVPVSLCDIEQWAARCNEATKPVTKSAEREAAVLHAWESNSIRIKADGREMSRAEHEMQIKNLVQAGL
ncbi:MAG: uncharacterized protein KVP18_002856 [Porospora cf. gigantea A]|uniref:uncharacterized protein n=1 Tax=Porospora cf. gigantea A TaxID=2853593 RepID=UPI00355A374F|nr:MAG: hypothetical protein KVP18_002856 [Porospora cf. gigantea A]